MSTSQQPSQSPSVVRLKFIDFDARREPKTTLYCIMCQRDLKVGERPRAIRVLSIDGGPYSVHPDDIALYGALEPHEVTMDDFVLVSGGKFSARSLSNLDDLGLCLIGADCARTHGLEWTLANE